MKGKAERTVCYLLYIINHSDTGTVNYQELSKVFSRSYSSVVHDLKLLKKHNFITISKDFRIEFNKNILDHDS